MLKIFMNEKFIYCVKNIHSLKVLFIVYKNICSFYEKYMLGKISIVGIEKLLH